MSDMSAPQGAETVRSLVDDVRQHVEQLSGPFFDQEDAKTWIEAGERLLKDPLTDVSSIAQVVQQLARICTFGQHPGILDRYGIPRPSYNLFEDFEEAARGPWDASMPSWLQQAAPTWRLLGRQVGLPIGIPASVLTSNASWIEYYARRGFNVLTYKTQRARQYAAHSEPNWVFLQDLDEPATLGEMPSVVQGDSFTWPKNLRSCSTANSFGVPSQAPKYWRGEVEEALSRLHDQQLLIVSVMGTKLDGEGDRDFLADWVSVAQNAEKTGAPAIELNLSCPNTLGSDHQVKRELLCHDPEAVTKVVRAVRDGLVNSSTRVVAKLSFMAPALLESVVLRLIGEVDAISGVNTVSAEVRRQDGRPTFHGRPDNPSADRTRAGVSGAAIRNHGLAFVRGLADIRRNYDLDFDIIGIGGVSRPVHVRDYLLAGADAVQAATGAFCDAGLGEECHAELHEVVTPRYRPELDPDALDASVLQSLQRHAMTPAEVAAVTALGNEAVSEAVHRLLKRRLIVEHPGPDETLLEMSQTSLGDPATLHR